MRYLLGSDEVAMLFGDRIEYRPTGVIHAVDVDTPVNAKAADTGYAVCGQPVLIWPDLAFHQDSADLHEDCREIVHATSAGSQRRTRLPRAAQGSTAYRS